MVEAVSGQWGTALPVHGVHVALPHAAGDGPPHNVQVTAMFTGCSDLMTQTVLPAHADRIVLVAVKGHGQGVGPRLFFTNQVYVDVLANFLCTRGASEVIDSENDGRIISSLMEECYLEIFLEDGRKLLSLHLVVIYPRLYGYCWILGARNAILTEFQMYMNAFSTQKSHILIKEIRDTRYL